MAGERGNEEAKKKMEWNDGDATLHSMSASRIFTLLHTSISFPMAELVRVALLL
jgi:hypothetical protein